MIGEDQEEKTLNRNLKNLLLLNKKQIEREANLTRELNERNQAIHANETMNQLNQSKEVEATNVLAPLPAAASSKESEVDSSASINQENIIDSIKVESTNEPASVSEETTNDIEMKVCVVYFIFLS